MSIQQSYELRGLRIENLRLKERLRASNIPIEDGEPDLAALPGSHLGGRAAGLAHGRPAAMQRRFRGSEWSDSIYIGNPCLANIVSDVGSIHTRADIRLRVQFADFNLAPASAQSLAHLIPRSRNILTTKDPPPHPFATIFPATPDECIPKLLRCLPTRDELLAYLNFFEEGVCIYMFPHIPIKVERREVERFLSSDQKNAQLCPDMLGLLFAVLALGTHCSAWNESGGERKAEYMQAEKDKGNVYS